MEHRFSGPAYTIGIEEELMILDAESLELVNAIESMLEPATGGEIKPELMESVLEISTDPCPNTAEAGEQLRALRRQVIETRGRQGAGDRRGRHAPVRDVGGPADRRPPPLPRPDLGAAVRRAPGADLRDPRPRRASTTPTRRSTSPTGCASTCRCCSGCRPTRPFWRADATGLASTRTPIFRAFPRVGIPPTYKDWEDYARGSSSWSTRA